MPCLTRSVIACAILTLVSGAGCTHRQLAKHTALTATTVNSIQYQMVLDNLALFSCQPEALPAHVRLADGTVQISNEAGIGESGGFTWLPGAGFGIERLGPAASTKVSEQWGTDAVEDPIQIFELQTIYRKAFMLPPLQQPNFIVAAKKARAEAERDEEKSSSDSSSPSESSVDSDDDNPISSTGRSAAGTNVIDTEPLPAPGSVWALAVDAGDFGTQTSEEVGADLDPEKFDIPTGWFMIGGKRDVPANACYVGSHGDRYAWVTADGVGSLAQFTLAVLTIIKLEAGESSGKSGMMFTP
jgi:hypothetical protein